MLKLKNLFVEYEGSSIPALNNVTMNIPKGKITALVGESGSGKTTLANSILASLPEDTRVEGSICDSKNRHIELAYGKDVSFVSQRFASSLSEYFTIYSQFDMLIRSKMRLKKKDRKKIISTLLSRFISDAEDKMRKYPFQLSGGEKQRILIAMAVAGNPQLLIADEPTSAIDTATRASLMKDLQKQNQERNTTMLVISHDLALVQNIADNIVVLYKGMIMESGSSTIMKNKPRHPYSKLLLSSRPDMKKKNLSEKKILNNSNGNECPFAPYCPEFEQNCKLVVNNGNQGSYCACSRAL